MYASKSPVLSGFVARKVACLPFLILVCREIFVTFSTKMHSLLSDLRHVLFARVGTSLYGYLHLYWTRTLRAFLARLKAT